MPSCSTSSNIRSSQISLTTINGGSRLLMSIPYIAGFTTGQVIRYDVPTSGYTAAKADQISTSEVFGVIESYDPPTSPTNVNVVVYGSISLDSNKFADMGSGGGSGGNDIYFLSGTTAGVLQNLAPTNINHIIKPVYQVAPHGSYTGVVVNYLGYKIGGDLQGSLQDTEGVGTIFYLLGENSTFEDGVVDASISRTLPISEYSEFYQQFGTTYGYIEKIQVSGSISTAVQINNPVTQPGSPSYSGTVSGIDFSNQTLFVRKAPNSALANLSNSLNITTNSGIVNISTLSSRQIYATLTPIITSNSPFVVTLSTGSEAPTQTVRIGLKVKPKGVSIFVPDTITVTNLIATGITWEQFLS